MKILPWLKTKYPEVFTEYEKEKLDDKRKRSREFYRKLSKAYKEKQGN